MVNVQFFVCSVLYYLGFMVFGWYIHFVEWSDILSCFVFKYISPVDRVYDYVVVGAGSAGSVVALRLSQNKNTSILVLEAGPRGGYFMDIPAIAPMMQLSPVDWQHKTIPQENACKAFNDNTSFWPMGRIVGGTSYLNNLIYARGDPADFRDWFVDFPGFDYDWDVLQYFKKSEDYHSFNISSQGRNNLQERNKPQGKNNQDKYHSNNGPYRIEGLRFPTHLQEAILKSTEELGYPTRDINGEFSTGFMRVQVNLESGRRCTTGHKLFSQSKPNLFIQTNAQVNKILFKSNFEAHSLQYTLLGETYVVKARKGIILSAGVVGTPKILMLSGIGPKEHLEKVGIPPKQNLPVGENLQDHITTGFDLVLLNKSINFDFIDMCSPFSICKYFMKSEGPWTMGGAEVIGVVKTNIEKTNVEKTNVEKTNFETTNVSESKPDLQLMVLPMGVSFEGGHQVLKSTNLKQQVFEKYFQPLIGKIAVTIAPIVLHPKSRGNIRLFDKDPKSAPVIDPNYLSHPYDVDMLLKGINFIKEIVKTKSMQELGARIYDKIFPGCEDYAFDTEEYWRCYVKQLTLSSFHPVGTCKMGSVLDKSTVVNYDFQVHNTNKLYVVDGSVFPSSVSANPNAAIIMLAERLGSVLLFHDYLSLGACSLLDIFIVESECRVY